MSDRDRFRDPDEREARATVADLIDASLRKIVTAIIVAGGLIAIAIWWSPYPHYQVAVGDGLVVRVNTHTGKVVACRGEVCAQVLENGQHLADHLPPPAPVPALPAPAATPAAATAPAATPAH
jgi:hypothetical protein